jgi:hypothetical protein
MKVILEPNAGDKYGDQIDLANELLEKGFVHEVQLQLNDGLKFMRTYHSPDEIRKFIWDGYDNDYPNQYDADELEIIPFIDKIVVAYNGKIAFTTASSEDPQELDSMYTRMGIQEALDEYAAMEDFDTSVTDRFIEWAEQNIVNFSEDFCY